MTEDTDLPIYEIPGFRLGEELGRGGTSRVFRGRQDTLDRDVAIKIITTLGEKGRQRALRLFREARLAGALDHPGIVRAIDAGEGDGFCWFAMDLIAGGSLEDHLEQVGRMSLDEVKELGLKVADALHHAHQRGVVHRDIKPSNILLDTGGEPRLSDLGLAKRPHDPRLTQEGGTLGTPQYMSPEQARSPGNVDARSDLFSLAATLYRALCGVPAFPGSNVAQVITQLLYSDPIAPSKHFASLPQHLDAFFARGLAKEADARFQTAKEFAEHLNAGGNPMPSRALDSSKRLRPPPREAKPTKGHNKHRRTLIIAGLVSVGALLLIFASPWFGSSLVSPGSDDSDTQVKVVDHRDTIQSIRDAADGRNAYAPMVLARRIDEVERLLTKLPEDMRADLRESLGPLIVEWKEEATAALSRLESQALDLLEKSSDADKALKILVSRWSAEKLSVPWRPDSRPDLQAWLDTLEQERMAGLRQAIQRDRTLAADRIAGRLDVWKLRHREELYTRATALESLNELMRSTPGYKLLSKEDRAKLEGEIAVTAASFAGAPSRWWIEQRKKINADILAQDWKSAREKWDEASAKLSSLLPEAAVELSTLKSLIQESLNDTRREVLALLELAKRKENLPLSQSERIRRVQQVGLGIEQRKGLMGQADFDSLLKQAEDYSRVMSEAAKLRTQLEEALLSAQRDANELPSFRPYLRAKVRTSSRQILRINAGVIHAQSPRGTERRYPIQDLTALSVAELLHELGIKPDPVALALLAHWDGDDFLVPILLGPASSLREDSQAMRVRQHAKDGLHRLAQSFDHAADRIAIGEWWEIQRDLADGNWSAAIKGLTSLKESLSESGRYRARRFWKKFGDQITALDRELRATTKLRELWQDHHPFVSLSSSGEVRLELPFHSAAGPLPNAASHPPTWRQTDSGLKARSEDEAMTVRPSDLPGLKLSLPPLGESAGTFELSLQVPKGTQSLGMLALELHRFSFMTVSRVANSASFLPLPLHGLERELWAFVPFERVGAWVGPLQNYLAELHPWGRTPWDIQPGDHTLKLSWDYPVKEIQLTLGKSEIIVPIRDPEVLNGGGFTLRCWPDVVIQGVRLQLTGEVNAGK